MPSVVDVESLLAFRSRGARLAALTFVLLLGAGGIWLSIGPRLAAARLGKMTDSDLVSLWKARRASGSPHEASYASYSIEEIARSADFMAQAKVIEIAPDRDSLIHFLNLSEREARSEGASEILWKLKLKIERSVPTIADASAEVMASGEPGWIKAGQRYLCGLKKTNSGYELGERELHPIWATGIVELRLTDYADGRTTNRPTPLPLDRAWTFISDIYGPLHGGSLPEERMRSLSESLASGAPQEAALALETLATIGASGQAASMLADALERQYLALTSYQAKYRSTTQPWKENSPQEFLRFAAMAMEALAKKGDAASAGRVLALYRNDMQDLHARVFEGDKFDGAIIGVALTLPPPDRRESVLNLASRTCDLRDDMGNRYDGFVPTPIGYWTLVRIAKTPGDDVEGILSTLLSAPAKYHLAAYLNTMSIQQLRRDITTEAKRP